MRVLKCSPALLFLALTFVAGCGGGTTSDFDMAPGHDGATHDSGGHDAATVHDANTTDSGGQDAASGSDGAVVGCGAGCQTTEYCHTPEGMCGNTDVGACEAIDPNADCSGDADGPVCGCDGNTYDNPCLAAKAGVSVNMDGACPPKTCTSNGDCAANEYCFTATGDCGGTGVCTLKTGCGFGARPVVCGCDGTTYSKSCYASAAGVSVASNGNCPLGANCCYSSFGDCSEDSECVGVVSSHTITPGVCKLTPTAPGSCWSDDDCPGSTCMGALVCPCGQSCFFADRQGTCALGTGCCFSSTDCGPGESCAGVGVNGFNSPGVCQPAPTTTGECWSDADCSSGTTCTGVSVCACGDSSCDPNNNRMGTCACTQGSCGPSQFCNIPNGMCGGTGTTCLARPASCRFGQPVEVCGCDGQNYMKACNANQADVPILHTFRCAGPGCCYQSTDCADGNECVLNPLGGFDPQGVCKPKPTQSGTCWSDADVPGSTCTGASVCPCGQSCPNPDTMGTYAVGAGCCYLAADCSGQMCVNAPFGPGECQPPPTPGSCWTAADCLAVSTCHGVTACSCGDQSCTEMVGTCVVGSGTCCQDNGGCPAGEECVGGSIINAGICKPFPTMGSCWSDNDCAGGTCLGAAVCGCNDTSCITDNMGTCR